MPLNLNTYVDTYFNTYNLLYNNSISNNFKFIKDFPQITTPIKSKKFTNF